MTKCLKRKGHTLLELVMSVTIFSLIMVSVFALLNIGLKSWQIGETTSDVQNAAQVTMERLKSDLKLSCRYSCVFDNTLNYIAFDSAMNERGEFKIDRITRTPLWNAYIIYFCKDDGKFKILYRKKIIHPVAGISKRPVLYTENVDFTINKDAKIMAKSVEKFEITSTGDLINIKLICARNIGDRKLPYEQDFDAGKIKTSIEVFTSVYPRNNY